MADERVILDVRFSGGGSGGGGDGGGGGNGGGGARPASGHTHTDQTGGPVAPVQPNQTAASGQAINFLGASNLRQAATAATSGIPVSTSVSQLLGQIPAPILPDAPNASNAYPTGGGPGSPVSGIGGGASVNDALGMPAVPAAKKDNSGYNSIRTSTTPRTSIPRPQGITPAKAITSDQMAGLGSAFQKVAPKTGKIAALAGGLSKAAPVIGIALKAKQMLDDVARGAADKVGAGMDAIGDFASSGPSATIDVGAAYRGASNLPGVDPITRFGMKVMSRFIDATERAAEGLEQLAVSTSGYTGFLAGAEANRTVTELRMAGRRTSRIGPQLSRLYQARTDRMESWDEFKLLLQEKFLPALITITEFTAGIFDIMSILFKLFDALPKSPGDIVNMTVNSMVSMLEMAGVSPATILLITQLLSNISDNTTPQQDAPDFSVINPWKSFLGPDTL